MGTSPGQLNQAVNGSGRRVLTGWKEISRYLRSGVRTAQRWENLGLPVRRIGIGPVRPVIAIAEELDAWQKEAPTRFSDVIGELKAKIYSLEIELTSLKQQLGNQRHPGSLRNEKKTRGGLAVIRSSTRPLRSAIQQSMPDDEAVFW